MSGAKKKMPLLIRDGFLPDKKLDRFKTDNSILIKNLLSDIEISSKIISLLEEHQKVFTKIYMGKIIKDHFEKKINQI